MPVPIDPGPFVDDALADADEVNARFSPLYAALDGALDEANMAVPKGAFRVHCAAALVIPASPGLITFDTEAFDTSNWYDLSTGRFTPQVEGYYRLSWGVRLSAVGASELVAALHKNGVPHAYGQVATSVGFALLAPNSVGSAVVVANGTTDYFDVRVFWTGGAPAVETGVHATFFCGDLIGRA